MKKQTDLVTLGDLREVIGELKVDLRKELNGDIAVFKAGIVTEVRQIILESEEKHTKYHDRILNSLDKVAGELDTWRTDKIIRDNDVEKLKITVAAHNKQLAKLKSAAN